MDIIKLVESHFKFFKRVGRVIDGVFNVPDVLQEYHLSRMVFFRDALSFHPAAEELFEYLNFDRYCEETCKLSEYFEILEYEFMELYENIGDATSQESSDSSQALEPVQRISDRLAEEDPAKLSCTASVEEDLGRAVALPSPAKRKVAASPRPVQAAKRAKRVCKTYELDLVEFRDELVGLLATASPLTKKELSTHLRKTFFKTRVELINNQLDTAFNEDSHEYLRGRHRWFSAEDMPEAVYWNLSNHGMYKFQEEKHFVPFSQLLTKQLLRAAYQLGCGNFSEIVSYVSSSRELRKYIKAEYRESKSFFKKEIVNLLSADFQSEVACFVHPMYPITSQSVFLLSQHGLAVLESLNQYPY
jgi:hypothetical protein